MLAPISLGRDVDAAVTASRGPAPENRAYREGVCHGGKRVAVRRPARCGMDSTTFYSDDSPEAREPLGLRPRQAAAKLGVSISTLERLTKAGRIPRVKLPRGVVYRVAALDEFLRQAEQYATQDTA
jgi:excisionase family DNA binding protein